MAKCDLCLKNCAIADMHELLPQYRINGVSDLCKSCLKWANEEKTEIALRIPTTMRSRILLKKLRHAKELD